MNFPYKAILTVLFLTGGCLPSYADATGKNAEAWGENTTASGVNATAWGKGTTANKNQSTAWGYNTTASGLKATAWGENTTAKGSNSTAWGSTTHATKFNDTAWGGNTWATGNYSTAWGSATTASGQFATAWGNNTIASGICSTAWGLHAKATGIYATAGGYNAIAAGRYSIALGTSSEVYGDNSFAAIGGIIGEGTVTSTQAISTAATAKATITKNVQYAAAIGQGATVLVDHTLALGSGSIADRDASTYDVSAAYKSDTDTRAAWIATHNAIAVGDDGTVTRQITGVAAGSEDTDAVNVAQLKRAISSSEADAVKYAANTDGTIDKSRMVLDEGGTTISHVKDGTIANDSTEAVNGSQLYTTNQAVSNNSQHISTLYSSIDRLDGRIKRVGAGAAALAALSIRSITIRTANGNLLQVMAITAAQMP